MSLHVTIDGVRCEPPPGASLFECAESVGVRVPTSCVKQGKCRECLVEVEEGMELLTPRSIEEAHLTDRFRLSCRARVRGFEGARVRGSSDPEIRCHTLRRGALRIETESRHLGDVPHELDPAITRDGRVVLLDGQAIAESAGLLHGLAIDIGTTTVALRLYDLESGSLRATYSFENPQRFGGSDIMARIRFDGEQKGRLLQRTLLGYLTHAIESLGADPLTIYEAVVAANTTMRDLFFGLDVQPIGQMPYRSIVEEEYLAGRKTTTSLVVAAGRLRLPIHPKARVYGMPLIASHVGGDAAACVLATGVGESDEITAVMDIGTNTELVIGNRRRILAASCPAGPAFEGGAVSCGMPALEGAIERVRLTGSGDVEVHVIGDASPVGVCGSGLVDLLSELRRTGRLTETGRFVDGASSFPLGCGSDLVLSESDINELAQAKGANAAGLRVVLDLYGVPLDDVSRLYLAGGFSRHLDVDAACRIGLIPDMARDRIVQVGNAALEGAAIALLSVRRRNELERRAARIEHVRLETHPQFFDCFVEGCQFAPFGHSSAMSPEP